ncbi:MAG: hypothetical protein ABI557_03995, partial [Aureliella sp.]
TPIETARDLTIWMSTVRPGQSFEVTYQRGTAARTSPLTLEVSPENRSANRTPMPDSVRTRPNRTTGSPAAPVPAGSGNSSLNSGASTPNTSLSETTSLAPTLAPTRTLATEPTGDDVVPNAIPTPVVPAAREANGPGSSTAEMAELRMEIARLRAELEKANQRLESTQNRLQKIIEGLGKE